VEKAVASAIDQATHEPDAAKKAESHGNKINHRIVTNFDCLFFWGSKPSSSDEERLEPFFGHRLTP
jgi:hypothetical protein